jgi:hypothetical protein
MIIAQGQRGTSAALGIQGKRKSTLKGLHLSGQQQALAQGSDATLSGLLGGLVSVSQGSSCLATLSWMMESRWDSQERWQPPNAAAPAYAALRCGKGRKTDGGDQGLSGK